MATGIEIRHARSCRSRQDRRCNCAASYRATVWDPRAKKLVRKTFHNRAEAEGWYHDAKVALRHGRLQAPSPITVREAADAWLAGAKAGSVRNRSGDPYKPSTLRGYERGLALRVLPAFGDRRLADLRRADVQALVDSLLADGVGPSTIRNTLDPLRAIC